MSKIRVFIAEDHLTVLEGFKMIVNTQEDMEVVGEADNGKAAISLARELQPDVVLMDISMPKLNGLKATAKLKRVAPDIKVLILTRHTDESYLQELLQAGISGYVLKQSPCDDLLRAIRAAANGDNYLDPAIAGAVFNDFDKKITKLRGEISGAPLTKRESKVLSQIAWGYTMREIAEQLDISIKTVESHKANALQKLNISRRNDIVRYAVFQGWLQEI